MWYRFGLFLANCGYCKIESDDVVGRKCCAPAIVRSLFVFDRAPTRSGVRKTEMVLLLRADALHV